jgi:integrase
VQVKLTAGLVGRVTQKDPPARDTSYFDLDTPRFALRVLKPRKPGLPWASYYFVRYVVGGRERHLKVAPGSLPLDEARRLGRIKLAEVDKGGDPAREKADARAAWTVAEAADAYTTSAEFAKKAERSQAEDTATLRLHIVHRLGREKLAAIDVPMVRRLIRAIEADARVNSRKRTLGGPGAARRAVRVLSALMTWAVGEGRLKGNPVVGNLRMSGGDNMRETVITEPAQYTALFEAMADLVATGKLRPAAQAFFVVVAATGMRRGEVQGLHWGDVDLTDRRVTLRASKGSKLARNGGPKVETVSLPPIAVAALVGIRPADAADDELVFMPRRGQRLSVHRDWKMVRAAAGLPGDLVLHGLRHSAATNAILAGLSVAEAQRLLRHRNIAITQRYLHLAEAAAGRLADQAMARVLPTPKAEGEA